jgi:ribose-phosphate pyrophosphokinase
MDEAYNYSSTRFGDLGIISMRGCEDMAKSVDEFICKWRCADEECKSYIIPVQFNRFGTGEGKAMLQQTVRGYDIFIICDVFNHGVGYKMYEKDVAMSPDEHYQDLKRAIAALGGKARRITVIMPMLYEGRQHKRIARESLDCAIALLELQNMGVENIITFDAHDARVQNAIPINGFDNIQPTYQMLKALLNTVPDIKLDRDSFMIISPDEGGIERCMYYSSVLNLDLGMFYKRRDYSRVVNGRNPIIAHEFLGSDVKGKDMLIVDDMIASGDSMALVGEKLKEAGARRIFIFSTFGLFTDGLSRFDRAYADGKIDKVFTTNMIYQTPELLKREWYCPVNMNKFIAYIIDSLNHDDSISGLIDPTKKINNMLKTRGLK